ncbi:MAG: hypothetical protein JO154_17970 [Chitinophaga sp.]|uniref:hypothetical protein n=1 Tax=Chitinophaga sp. TaxID=1869181 RepID=UPI0025C67928|nr:hypothetical protein [Chitinophaga sp.]MBV8254493.1 hypothetical protein [Chitinophaga sp.]
MHDQYNFHHGVRLGRILRQKKISVIRFAAMTGIVRQWVYDNLEQSDIKKKRLVELLAAFPMTLQEFYCWNSIQHDNSSHQGEMLLTYMANNHLKVRKVAKQLGIKLSELYKWGELRVLSKEQLLALQTSIQFAPEHFISRETNNSNN